MINQMLVLMSAYGYFAMVLDANKGKMPKELMKLYRTLAKLCYCSDEELHKRMLDINKIVKSIPAKDVDYLLLSVSIIAEYYMQTRGKKRYYTPMSNKNILNLQDDLLEGMPKEIWQETFNYAEELVRRLLNERSR